MKIIKFIGAKTILLILMLLCILAAIYYYKYAAVKVDYTKVIQSFEKKLHEKEGYAETILSSIEALSEKSRPISFNALLDKCNDDVLNKKDLSLFVYSKDTLLFWSNNSVPINDKLYDAYSDGDYIRLKNGNYVIKYDSAGQYTTIALILIKTEYKYNNEYLVNEFQKDFDLPGEFTLTDNITRNSVHNKRGHFLFSIEPSNALETEIYNRNSLVSVFFYLIAFFIFFILLVKLYKILSIKYGNGIVAATLVLLMIILRLLMFTNRIPEIIYNLSLFGPAIYAGSEFLPSFGDLIVNIVVFTFLSVFLYKNLKIEPQKLKAGKGWLISLAIVLSTIPLFFSNLSVYLLKNLIINSNISFNINNIFELTAYSYFGFILVGFLLFSLFLLIEKISRYIIYKLVSPKELFIVLACALIIYLGVCYVFLTVVFAYFLPFLIVFGIILYNISKYNRSINVSAVTIYLIFFTFFTNVVLYETNDYKEKEKRKTTAIRLSKKGDPIGEYIFGEISAKIKDDKRIVNLLKMHPLGESDLIKLIQNYFKGYWTKYDVQLTICRKNDRLIIKPDNVETDCYNYFYDKIKINLANTTKYDNFYNVNTNTGRNSYIAVFSFRPTPADTLIPNLKIFVELDSKFIPKELGYPELLIDKKTYINSDLGNYSYAKYYNNEQIMQFGNFFYSLKAQNYRDYIKGEFNFFCKDNYDHLLYKTGNTTVIVSKKSDNFFNVISPFSYLFAFNFVLVLLVVILMNIPIDTRRLKVNYKNRVQISMISVVLVSFIFIGGGAVYYIVSLYKNKNNDNITEKTHSILVEIERKFSDKQELTPDMYDLLTEQMVKYSNVFFTDVNLYDTEGNLIASSRQKIFDEGLISRKMNPEAFVQLKTNRKNLFVHDESIGKLNYLSAYIPFRNDDNQTIAFLNLPYFAKQSELKKEISSFLVKFINIYVLLIAIAILIALIISNRITKPLRLIRENISQLMLGKRNKKITWNKKDEIGSLIKEYNRMIDELEKSAELLAKSERESAWREMAKQVAHEIKNPLTPMKLSVQHLQKSWKDKTENWDERLEKFSKTIIEQIDSLSQIASEFSNFAKMPKSSNEIIELGDLIQSAIELYNSFENVSVVLKKEENQQYYVFADKKQFLRIFNNLIKNSLQAIEGVKKGIICISISSTKDYHKISIADNGSGISKEQLNKIFSPNFTTKSGGMGLGLAMVKNIIEGAGGTITFHSEEGVGTTFDIILPTYKSENYENN